MFSLKDITDTNLPDKTLCLTYDDGPGKCSAEIGRFLHERGVRATFFVVGKFAVEHSGILDDLHANGHIIGNHTFEHPDMPYYASVNGDLRDQIIRTNLLIQKYNQNKVIYFRAPYGKWSPEVANELNLDIRSSFRHVGPVYWDIDGVDCYYWKLGKSVEEASETYLKDISKKGKGVIVMHDSISDMDVVKAKNKTLELTRHLIPKLQDLGYKFVGLDEINDPQLTTSISDTFALKGQNGKFLKYTESETSTLSWSGNTNENGNQFYTERKGEGKIVLRTSNGRYLQVDPDTDETVKLNSNYSVFALFDDIPVNETQMMLRTHNGNYLAAETKDGGLLKANARFMRQAWCISYVPTRGAYLKPLGLSKRLNIAKKRFLFIKSKLLQS